MDKLEQEFLNDLDTKLWRSAVFEEEDGEPFNETMKRLTAQLSEQFKESARLEAEIKKHLLGIGYEV
jgi:type I restriction enzyme M protein